MDSAVVSEVMGVSPSVGQGRWSEKATDGIEVVQNLYATDIKPIPNPTDVDRCISDAADRRDKLMLSILISACQRSMQNWYLMWQSGARMKVHEHHQARYMETRTQFPYVDAFKINEDGELESITGIDSHEVEFECVQSAGSIVAQV